MADKNVFDELREENDKKFQKYNHSIKDNISDRKNIWSFLAGLIELYVPRVYGSLFGITDFGGSNNEEHLDHHDNTVNSH